MLNKKSKSYYKSLILILLAFNIFSSSHAKIALFKRFPDLEKNIKHIELCDLPTPVIKLKNFGKLINCKNLYIKRDDLTGKINQDNIRLYGGNKPRKLEFLMADAQAKSADTIITYGGVGSNHALATAVYANKLGLKSILMLTEQPNSYTVRHNLLLDKFYNAELRFFSDRKIRDNLLEKILEKDNKAYFIPVGGSNSIGTIGFVNAAFELAEQIKDKKMPEPDYIYVATGSAGTTAGLLLGIKLTKLRSKIVSVYIELEPEDNRTLENIKSLFIETNRLLNKADISLPILEFPTQDLIINKDFCSKEYGLFLKDTVRANRLFISAENIRLEDTYSSKPIAAIIEDIKNNKINSNQTILFWNTYCGIDYSYLPDFNNYKALPKEFHKYFEQDVQPLSFN